MTWRVELVGNQGMEWNEQVINADLVMRNGYRYIPLNEDEQEQWINDATVTLSPHDRSIQVLIHDSGRLLVHQDAKLGGYRSCMATHGISYGTAYFEALISGNHTLGNVRMGLARLQAHLGGPVGMDKFGYGLTDSGHIVHDARKTPFWSNVLPSETIIGILVHLPKGIRPFEQYVEQTPFDHKGRKMLQCKLKMRKRNHIKAGSFIKFFINGQDAGVAFKDLFDGTYFPMFSVYRGGCVQVNFGPRFVYGPGEEQSFVPWSSLRGYRTKMDMFISNQQMDHQESVARRKE